MAELFRASVGAVVVGPDRLVLAVERMDSPGSWQLPQGGIESGEDPEEALWRELREETGLGSVDARLVAATRRWLSYELPPEMRTRPALGMGQTQRWYLLALQAEESSIRLDDRELRAWAWTSLAALSATTVGFRRSIYAELRGAFELG